MWKSLLFSQLIKNNLSNRCGIAVIETANSFSSDQRFALPTAIKSFSFPRRILRWHYRKDLQSWTKLLEKVFPIMSTVLRNKAISKTTPLRKENPFPQSNVASHKRPGIRLSFEYTTTLLSGGEGRTGTGTMFIKMLSKYTIFSPVLSKIVDNVSVKTATNSIACEQALCLGKKFAFPSP